MRIVELDSGRKLLLSVASIVCFANSYNGRFVFDDAEAIVNNRDVVGNDNKFWWRLIAIDDFWGTPLLSNVSHKSWRPLTTATFGLNYWLSGLEPCSYHLVNIVLHAIIVLLLYDVLKETLNLATNFPKRSARISFWTSLLFSVHPVHTECVSSVVGRAELLGALFFLLCMKTYCKYLTNKKNHKIDRLVLCFAYSSLSVLSKEQGVMSLVVCLLYDVLINSRRDLKHLRKMWKHRAVDLLNNNNADKNVSLINLPVWALIRRTLYLCVFVSMQFLLRMWIVGFEPPSFTPADNPASFHPNRLIRTVNYNYIYALNAWLLINPSKLCFDYSMGCVPLIETLFDYRVFFVISFWISSIVLIAHLFRCENDFDSKCLCYGVLFLVIPFIPASNLLFRVGFVIAERILYLPSIGYCILLAVAFERLRCTVEKSFHLLLYSGFVLLLCSFACKSVSRSAEWSDEVSLFTSGAHVCPTNAKVHYNLGKTLNDFGAKQEAEIAYKNALKLNPNYDQAMNNLANLLKDNGDFEEAETLLEKALNLRPNFAAAWMNLGIVKAALKKYTESERCYLNALFYRVSYADCYFNLGNLYLEMDRDSEALSSWLNATKAKPDHNKAWINIILLLDNRGDTATALEYGRMALAKVPSEAAVYFAMANCLGKLDKFAESERYFKIALKLDDSNANYYNNLGVLYHRWKKFEAAEAMYSKALQINPQLQHTKEHLNKVKKHSTKKYSSYHL